MKKLSVLCGALLLIGASANSQNIDEKDVTITMDLQPILQLDMSSSDQLEFIFDDVSDYYAGITRYGATQLRVSASVSWDLYAVGRSNNGKYWDVQTTYGNGAAGNGDDRIPLSALELRQSRVNNGMGALAAGTFDYSGAFLPNDSTSTIANYSNSIFYGTSVPTASNRYIAGHKGPGATTSIAGGSYLNQSAITSNYFYVIDYRIVPGLPATFPFAVQPDVTSLTPETTPTGYALPGVYSMYVQYVLLEDQ
jgi:hypothetical protein